MKLSLNWIKEYVDLPHDLAPSKLSHDLTMSTVEVEDVVDLAAPLQNIVVGKILEVSPHPNADRLRLCQVSLGEGIREEIVCGGINLAPGMNVIVAKPGAMVRWHGEGEPVKIGLSKIRGVASYGMICSSGEIGLAELFPSKQDGEIVDLTSFDCEAGAAVADVLGLNDIILEIDNKSLTNRPDLWSHYGIARELAAIYHLPLKALSVEALPTSSEGLDIQILSEKACSRYAALLIQNVSPKESPFWLKLKVWSVGMRPINLLVDVTNYVMLAVGQPTHGFDATHVKGGIIVRQAHEGEKLMLLNGKELSLTEADLVIADHKEPLALAGIMGGEKDSILDSTDQMVLEVANFHPIRTRKTAQRYELRTEASMRFEKGLDPQRVDQALSLSIKILKQECPEIVVASYLDCYPRPLECARVDLPLSLLERQIGHRMEKDEILSLLSSLGFSVEIHADTLQAVAPSWRSTGDISLPDDIIEEIARLFGYENFPVVNPTMLFSQSVNQRGSDLERRIREYLALRCGMQEIFTYPWMKDSFMQAAKVDREQTLKLSTPPAPDESCLRSTLVPNLIEAASKNTRYFEAFRIFEMTQVFLPDFANSPNSVEEKLPLQPRYLGAAFVGKDPVQLFREAKGILESLGRLTQTAPLTFTQQSRCSWGDEALWLNVFQEERLVGVLALLSPACARAAGIKRASVVLFELNMENILPYLSRENKYLKLPEYPQVEFDLSVIFDESIKWSEIEQSALQASKLIKKISFIDEYRGKQIPEGKKSVMFRMLLGDDSATLTSEQVEKIVSQITKKLGQKLSGEVRTA